MRSWLSGDPITRTSFAVLWNRAGIQTWEGAVDLTGDSVEATPHFTVDEYHEVVVDVLRIRPGVLRPAGTLE